MKPLSEFTSITFITVIKKYPAMEDFSLKHPAYTSSTRIQTHSLIIIHLWALQLLQGKSLVSCHV